MIRRRLAELGERVAALEARLAELERRDAPTEWTAVPEARDGPLELELDGRPLPVWAPAAPTVPLEDDPDEERFRAQRSRGAGPYL